MTHEEWKSKIDLEARRVGEVLVYSGTCPICSVQYDVEILGSHASARVLASQRIASHILDSHRDRVTFLNTK